MTSNIKTIEWRDNALYLLDQRLLPFREIYLKLVSADEVADAISNMVVRGAPAIGVTAAYGVAIAAINASKGQKGAKEKFDTDLKTLITARPTAVNLARVINDMSEQLIQGKTPNVQLADEILQHAHKLHREDIATNIKMGDLGAQLIDAGSGVITHCNTGSLATAGYGTALGVIRSAWADNKLSRIYADETRPWLQGARLTAWELYKDNIPVTLITDSAAAYVMSTGVIQWVIVGADRIAANGDVANKIGTYSLAIAARYHGVKFMVVAPEMTIDMNLASGREIPIEQRNASEVLELAGERIAAPDAKASNPAFDITPAELIDALVTDKGVIMKPATDKMLELFA